MEDIKSPLAARNLPAGTKSAVIHAYGTWHEAILKGRHDLFSKLDTKLGKHGIRTYLVEGNSRTSRALLAEGHLHLIVGGPPQYAPNVLHIAPSYIWGFWYVDEIGIGAHSSMRFARFPAEEVDRDKADYFFNGVTGYMLRENVSKLRQEPRMDAPLRLATATILCQTTDPQAPRTHYLTTEEMIVTAARVDPNALVYVKPHPHQSKLGRQKLLKLAEDHPNVKISDASIHDLIEAARVVITQNSSAGFEALMQKKPVITCGKTDYWHATLTPKNITDLRAAIEFGPETMANFDYEGYFTWFLEKQCLEPAKDTFEARLWTRIRDKLMLD